MEVDWKLSLFVFLFGIPGVLCRDNYDVGGMVAAAAVGVIFLVAAIFMAVFICFWPNYYHRQQLLRGKHRVARPKRKPWWRSTRYTTSTVVTHSKSDHKHKHNMVPMYHIDGVKGDASSTFQGRVRAENWMQNLPYDADTHETKSKTIHIGQEEEPIIIADVLPPGRTETVETARSYTYLDPTPSSNLSQTRYTASQRDQTQYVTGASSQTQYITGATNQTQYTGTETDTLEPIHIKMETVAYDNSGDMRSSQLRTSGLRSTQIRGEQVHIQTGRMSDDIVISPIIPPSDPGLQESQTFQVITTSQERQPNTDLHQSTGEDEAVIQFRDSDSD